MNSTSRFDLKRYGTATAVAAAATLTLSSCAVNEGGATEPAENGGTSLTGTLSGVGASSQAAAQEAWIAEFQTANPEVTVNYAPEGSGAGRQAIINGGADFAGSDAALSEEELGSEFVACAEGTTAIDLPVYISPIAIIFNVEGIDELNLDAATLAGIFSGTIATWDAPEIAALNPDAALPSAPITPVHRADDSGTTENFVEYLSAVAPDVWTAEPSGNWPQEFGGEAAQGTSGVVEVVTGGTNTIGYVDASRAGNLGVVSIEVGDEFVEYSPEAAAAIVDASPLIEGREENDIAIELDRTSEEAGVYPIVLVSYLLACQDYEDDETASLVKEYLGYVASPEGQAAAEQAAGIAPISEDLYERVSTAIDSIQ